MQRLNRTLFPLLGCVVAAMLTLSACGSDSSPDDADQPPATSAQNSDDEQSAAPPASEPTGRFTLDGETWDLTYDTADLNARCTIVANSASVRGMRTPDGSQVELDVAETPENVAIATYLDATGKALRRVETGESSQAPEWNIDGSTIRVSGLWAHRLDSSQPEVKGELEITC